MNCLQRDLLLKHPPSIKFWEQKPCYLPLTRPLQAAHQCLGWDEDVTLLLHTEHSSSNHASNHQNLCGIHKWCTPNRQSLQLEVRAKLERSWDCGGHKKHTETFGTNCFLNLCYRFVMAKYSPSNIVGNDICVAGCQHLQGPWPLITTA